MYNYNVPYPNQFMLCSTYGMDFSMWAYNTALNLIREALQSERNDELKFNYLIENAPTQEEKDIITTIRDDERLNRQWYRDIYKFYTNEEVENNNGGEFTEPDSFLDGIKSSIFESLFAMQRSRIIREGLPSRFIRDIVLRILTDEMKHATEYNYILTINSLNSNLG